MNKKIEILLKFSIVNGFLFMLAIPVLTMVITIILDYYSEAIDNFVLISIFIGMGFGILMILLMPIGRMLLIKPTKAEKYTNSFRNFNELFNIIEKHCLKNSYIYENKKSALSDLHIFANKNRKQTKMIFLSHIEELTEEILKEIEILRNATIEEHNKEYALAHKTAHITIICVNKSNQLFKKYTHSNIIQEFLESKLPVGISFENDTTYIAKQKDGLFIVEYKKLRKLFLKIMKDKIEK